MSVLMASYVETCVSDSDCKRATEKFETCFWYLIFGDIDLRLDTGPAFDVCCHREVSLNYTVKERFA